MRLTLREVFEQHSRIAVPLLQRDYAHGRPTAKSVRTRFLQVLRDALSKPDTDPSLPLDLDFVYGSYDGDAEAFAPLDGQQRLTTLFLLHWYLAGHDGRFDDFRRWAFTGGKSAFSYRVRPSAEDFFDALLGHGCGLDLSQLPSGATELSRLLRDKPWFFQSWQLDPTIDSCLIVLDDIHGMFADSAGLYERVVDAVQPAITFQFLHLDEFGLSDDLYIRMNARGKALTPFETFKASLEGRIPELLPGEQRELGGTPVALRTYVAQQFDTAWCDLFWSFCDEKREHDAITMNAVRAVALVSLVRHGPEGTARPVGEIVSHLRAGSLDTFHDLDAAGCLSAGFVRDLVTLFDRWSGGEDGLAPMLDDTDYFDEERAFVRVLSGQNTGKDSPTYAEWVQFIGWCLYGLSEQPDECFGAWMRVVANLAKNTIYNRITELMLSAEALAELIDHAGPEFLSHLASADPVRGFNQQQAREERLKAQLLERSTGWRQLIGDAETHKYFAGQIEFLFVFSDVLPFWLDHGEAATWSETEDQAFQESFRVAATKARTIFVESPKPGLRSFPDHIFERALLCEGDYLLSNRNNSGFLDSTDRDLSWKRLLRSDLGKPSLDEKRLLVRRLLDRVDPSDVQGSLLRRIADGVEEQNELFPGWRQRLVEAPSLIGYCQRRQIRVVQGEAIYLLTKVRRSGFHKELFTAALYPRICTLAREGRLGAFNYSRYDEMMTDTMLPRISLSANAGFEPACSIIYRAGFYELVVPQRLRPQGIETNEPWRVPLDSIESELCALGDRWETG